MRNLPRLVVKEMIVSAENIATPFKFRNARLTYVLWQDSSSLLTIKKCQKNWFALIKKVSEVEL